MSSCLLLKIKILFSVGFISMMHADTNVLICKLHFQITEEETNDWLSIDYLKISFQESYLKIDPHFIN